MVFWLGSRYLSDSMTFFNGSIQLQHSVTHETTLFDLAKNLDLQRNAVQKVLIDSVDFDSDREALSVLNKKTEFLFEKLRSEIIPFDMDGQKPKRLKYRHGQQSIDTLVGNLEDKFDRMSISNSIIARQTYFAYGERDDSIRMKLFDAYGGIIEAVNNLRKRAHGLPNRDYIEVLAAHDIKNFIWTLSETVNQTSGMLESYLRKHRNSSLQNVNKENLDLLIRQQIERSREALMKISEMVQIEEVAGVSGADVKKLENQYGAFKREANKLLQTPPRDIDADDSFTNWQELSEETKSQIQMLTNAALTNTIAIANSIRSKAVRSLIASILLVLFCVAMAYTSFRIARKIQHQADHDELTDLPNRRYFQYALNTLVRKTDTDANEKLVLMTLDLNGFKAINDTMGHVAGDQLLVQLAARLKSIVKENTVLARMGGDEFSIAFNFTDTDEPYHLASELRDVFNISFHVEDAAVNVDSSIGYSIYPDDANSLKELQITSDFAMFSAKQAGRRSIRHFNKDIAARLEKRIQIEKDLPIALEKNELELYYQPKINLENNHVDSVEALIRWNHPKQGLVSPMEFVSVAEEAGLMPAMGSCILNEACRQAAIWNNEQHLPIRVAINVSVHQIAQTDFVQEVKDTVARHKISPEYLELEITESVVMTDIEWIIDSLNSLKEFGFRIALDDFGTGYSSLSQLNELPLDTLKIDRSFIDRIDDDSVNIKSVTATIASIAEIYQLETVAEGIETKSQLEEVRKLGIDVAQGYFYSKPVSSDELPDVISNIYQMTSDIQKAA